MHPAGVGKMQSPDASTSMLYNTYADHGPPRPHSGIVPRRLPSAHSDNPGDAAGYDDDYIEYWRPLMPLDARKLTRAQRRVILAKLYVKSFIVYDRLAEI